MGEAIGQRDATMSAAKLLLLRFCALFAFVLMAAPSRVMGLADDLQHLTGYFILGNETIEEFEGCEWGQWIEFSLGGHVTCEEFGYQYAYYVSTVLLVRPFYVDGETVFSCKMAVQSNLYDVDCSTYLAQQVRTYRQIANNGEPDHAEYARHFLRLLRADTRPVSCPTPPDMDDPSTWSPELRERVEAGLQTIEEEHPGYQNTVADPAFKKWTAEDRWRIAAADSWEAIHSIELIRQWKEHQRSQSGDIPGSCVEQAADMP